MPIYLNRDLSNYNSGRAPNGCGGNSSGRLRHQGVRWLDIALVNNMPDRALRATEHQFISLLDSVAAGVAVRLSFYALPQVPRTEVGQRHISSFYSSIGDLWNREFDGLIVTGTEPRTSRFQDEPYWKELSTLIDWAEHCTHSAIWSCLAAHAAVLHNSGVPRVWLTEKRFGLFECTMVSDHALLEGVRSGFAMPHSRWNDLSEMELLRSGYQVLTRSVEAGVDMFVKHGRSLFVFFQGHPEYEAKTLLHEYARDVRRFLSRESDVYPDVPHGCCQPNCVAALTAFRDRALGERDEALVAEFTRALPEMHREAPWRPAAMRIYRNWLMSLCAEKEQARRKGLEQDDVIQSRQAAAGD